MDLARFSEFKTGRIEPITVGERTDYAFCPNPLPVNGEIDESLWPLLSEASDKLNKLDGIGMALPSPSLLLRPLQRREALTSNSLEGTFVTPKELLLFEGERQRADKGDRASRVADWLEVLNYDEALQLGCQRISEGRALGHELLCELHGRLLMGARGREKSPGRLRDRQNYIGADRRYIPPPPSQMEAALLDWEEYLNADSKLHPLIRAYLAHYQFEAIHPFMDGNGRIGRLWLSLTIYKWMRLSRPWLYMSEFFEKNRRDYIERLFAISTHGEWHEWLTFCLLGTREQAERTIERCNVLRKMKHEYLALAGHLGPRMSPLVELLFENPFVDVAKVRKRFNVTYPTARKDVERLVDEGILEPVENSHPKQFISRGIFWAAYGD